MDEDENYQLRHQLSRNESVGEALDSYMKWRGRAGEREKHIHREKVGNEKEGRGEGEGEGDKNTEVQPHLAQQSQWR